MSIIDAFRLDGKVAVVTGANTGLGQGMSVALAQAGAKVVGVARRSCEDTKKHMDKLIFLLIMQDLLREMMLLILRKMNGIVLFRLIRRWYSF